MKVSRGYGATAARLTPDQIRKVGSSNLSALNSHGPLQLHASVAMYMLENAIATAYRRAEIAERPGARLQIQSSVVRTPRPSKCPPAALTVGEVGLLEKVSRGYGATAAV